MFRMYDWLATGLTAGLLSASQSQSFSDAEKIIGQWGAPLALVVYFVFRDQSREQRMAKRINELETFQQTEMTRRIEMTAGAMQSSADAQNKQSQHIGALIESHKRMIERMSMRPCLLPDKEK